MIVTVVVVAVQLCEVVKLGAMSLGAGSPEPQVLLLHAARDVAAALRDLAAATTAASGKHVAHPDMQRLKHAAKVCHFIAQPVDYIPSTVTRIVSKTVNTNNAYVSPYLSGRRRRNCILKYLTLHVSTPK